MLYKAEWTYTKLHGIGLNEWQYKSWFKINLNQRLYQLGITCNFPKTKRQRYRWRF